MSRFSPSFIIDILSCRSDSMTLDMFGEDLADFLLGSDSSIDQ